MVSFGGNNTNEASTIPLAFAIEGAGAAAGGMSLTAAGALAAPLMFNGDSSNAYEAFSTYGAVAGTFPWQHSKSYDIVEDIYARKNSSGYYLHYTTLPNAFAIFGSKTILPNSRNKVYLTNALMTPVEVF